MSSPDNIAQQQNLLKAYRRNLDLLVRQAATYGGEDAVPISVANSLDQTRDNIARIKGILRGWDVTVEDLPDETVSGAAATIATQPVVQPYLQSPAEIPQVKGSAISTPPPALSSAELRSLRLRASAAYYARRWAEGEPLLAQLVAADPSDAEARERLRLLNLYSEVAELRAAGDWEAVLSALSDLAHAHPGFADPAQHRTWAEVQQRHDAAYEAALAACDRADWAAAEAALVPLLAEQPDDQDAAALRARVREELAEQQRKAEADHAARKRLEEERQRQAAEIAAQKAAAEHQRRAAEARARIIDPIKHNLNARQYAAALKQLTAILKANPQDAEAASLAAELIEDATVPLAERLRAGDLAGQYGDPRPGVVRFPPAMVPFAGGPFQIGNTPAEYQAIIAAEKLNTLEQEARNWYKDTVNQQSVAVGAFELARYPVTNWQWALFMAADGYQPDQPWWDAADRAWLARDDKKTAGLESWQKRNRKDQPSHWHDARLGKDHPNYPVVGINWYEAVVFCRWLTQHLNDGYTYTLPSEPEWEYACRGVARRMYAWGDQALDGEHANFARTHSGTTAVGCFPAGATPEGLLDMAGNVWEWNRSEYRDYPYNPNDGREDKQNPGKKRYTLCGVSWSNLSFYLRASDRLDRTPDNYRSDVGFRLARHLKV